MSQESTVQKLHEYTLGMLSIYKLKDINCYLPVVSRDKGSVADYYYNVLAILRNIMTQNIELSKTQWISNVKNAFNLSNSQRENYQRPRIFRMSCLEKNERFFLPRISEEGCQYGKLR